MATEQLPILNEIDFGDPEVFNEDHEYGAYGVLGVKDIHSPELQHAVIVTTLPYNAANALAIQEVLMLHMKACVPEYLREYVKWITRQSCIHYPLNRVCEGTVGWVYKKNGTR